MSELATERQTSTQWIGLNDRLILGGIVIRLAKVRGREVKLEIESLPIEFVKARSSQLDKCEN